MNGSINSNNFSADFGIQGVHQKEGSDVSSETIKNVVNNLGFSRIQTEVQPKPKSSFNPSDPSGLDEENHFSPSAHLHRESNSEAVTSNQTPNLGQYVTSKASGPQSLGYNANNINSKQSFPEANLVDGTFSRKEEQSQKLETKKSQESDQPTKGSTFGYDESEFTEAIKSEQENLEALLKDLYAGFNKKEVLSDQKVNEPYLLEFFQKYPQNKTDSLAVMLAGLYLALDDLEGTKVKLARISDPNITDDSAENAGYHRAYYIMQANLNIEENNFEEARKMLKQAYNIPQTFFTDGKESFADFYSTSMGRIHLKEGNLKEAEECFRDALAQRLLSKNSRLISSSYNDLALLYIEKKNDKAEEGKALQYLNKAREYDRVFQQELDKKKYNVLSGQVDYKRPEIAKTEEAYKKLLKS